MAEAVELVELATMPTAVLAVLAVQQLLATAVMAETAVLQP